ncbi:lipase family protein [archaeon]|nr:MAG: lipase family protein [archaeon]
MFVAYRGSTSISDWVNNLDAILTSYPKCSGCEVHKGFYVAEQSVISAVISNVKSLKQQFPSYSVVVTGHSLGAAMATLTTLDLMDAGVSPIRMFHFGSPRVGNTNFANFASNKIGDRNRNTHYKDMVPHVPMHER